MSPVRNAGSTARIESYSSRGISTSCSSSDHLVRVLQIGTDHPQVGEQNVQAIDGFGRGHGSWRAGRRKPHDVDMIVRLTPRRSPRL